MNHARQELERAGERVGAAEAESSEADEVKRDALSKLEEARSQLGDLKERLSASEAERQVRIQG